MQKRQSLFVTSNFNARPERFERFLEYLESLLGHFDIVINASCEATGESAELIREGLSWARLEKNVRALLHFIRGWERRERTRRIYFALHAAQNALSLACLPDFLGWALQLEAEHGVGISLNRNVVSFPEYLSAQAILPREFARYCREGARIAAKHRSGHDYVPTATWPLYGRFLKSLATGLESREPNARAAQAFRVWYLSLPELRKESFRRNFRPVYESLLKNTS